MRNKIYSGDTSTTNHYFIDAIISLKRVSIKKKEGGGEVVKEKKEVEEEEVENFFSIIKDNKYSRNLRKVIVPGKLEFYAIERRRF